LHYIGYLIYGIIVGLIALVPAANELVVTSFKLATEITIGCLVVAAYPPLLFFYYHVRGFKSSVYYERMCSVIQTCGNTVVSLGLIGTFVGLTNMIAKIASAIGGEGGSIDEQIAIIMTAIGESLDAMSFAFLTSVMGVAASVVIFAAAVYFKTYFDKTDSEDDFSDEALEERLQRIEGAALKQRKMIGRIISSSVDRREMASLIINNTTQIKGLLKVTTNLSKSAASQSDINSELIKSIEAQKEQMNQIAENQKLMLEFLSGSHVELKAISTTTKTLSDSQNESGRKLKTAIRSLRDGMQHLVD